jgi:hypothetical protein
VDFLSAYAGATTFIIAFPQFLSPDEKLVMCGRSFTLDAETARWEQLIRTTACVKGYFLEYSDCENTISGFSVRKSRLSLTSMGHSDRKSILRKLEPGAPLR